MSDFANYCCELLSCLGPCRARRMFGGYGISCDGLNVGLIMGDLLYLKADAQTRERFAAQGCAIFQYTRKDREVNALNYWTVPTDAMDSPRLMEPWARLAMDAALRAKPAPKKPRLAKTLGKPSVKSTQRTA